MYHESHDLCMSIENATHTYECLKCGVTDKDGGGLHNPCSGDEDTVDVHDPPHETEEQQYLTILENILEVGVFKDDRTGMGCYSLFGQTMKFDLSGGRLPLLTTKKMGIKSILAELLWFLEGSTDNNRLNELGAKIWNEWATEDGSLGPIYGKQYRHWTDTRLVPVEEWLSDEASFKNRGFDIVDEYWSMELGESIAVIQREIDQIQNLIDSLKNNPNSRRHIVTAWNPAVLPESGHSPQENVELGNASLAACHAMFQVHTRELNEDERWILWKGDEKRPKNLDEFSGMMDSEGVPRHALTLQLTQRSADYPIGIPYNIASYAILAHLLAHCTGMVAEELIHHTGDSHIYRGQIDGVEEQLNRKPFPFPKLQINSEKTDIFSFTTEDFTLIDYQHHPRIDFGDIAV